MERQRAALIQMRDAVNRRDANGYAAVYGENATISIFGSAAIAGRDAIEKYETGLLDQFPDARFAILETWHRGDDVVAHYAVNARVPGGAAMGHEGLLLLKFDAAGLIEREDRYQDSLTPMAQLGVLRGSTPRALPVLSPGIRSQSSADTAIEARNTATLRRVLETLHLPRRPSEVPALVTAGRFDELILAKPFVGEGAAAAWLDYLEGITAGRFAVTTTVAAGDDVMAFGVLHGVLARPIGAIQPSVKPFAVHRAVTASFDDRGRIKDVRSFINGKELAEQLGQWPLK